MAMSQIDMVITEAEKHIGVKESPPNSNNVIFNTRYYGRAVSGSAYAWCMVFIWFIFQETSLQELFYGGGKTASCTTLMNYAKNENIFEISRFRRGDIALFSWSGSKTVADHTGIITEVRADSVVTIEGNTSVSNDSDGGEVMRRTRSLSQFIGVYRPLYKADDGAEKRYDTISETPEWARPTVEKLVKKEYLRGSGKKDESGRPIDLSLSEDMLRLLVINDRAGLYGE